MEESILATIKKLLGVADDYGEFDLDIITHINSALMVLGQLGVGPANGFSITGSSEKWSDFLADESMLTPVRTVIYLRVRLIFDPPSSSSVMDVIQKQIDEYEWRLNIQADRGDEP